MQVLTQSFDRFAGCRLCCCCWRWCYRIKRPTGLH